MSQQVVEHMYDELGFLSLPQATRRSIWCAWDQSLYFAQLVLLIASITP